MRDAWVSYVRWMIWHDGRYELDDSDGDGSKETLIFRVQTKKHRCLLSLQLPYMTPCNPCEDNVLRKILISASFSLPRILRSHRTV